MFYRCTFVSPLPKPVSQQPLKSVLLTGLLLVLFLSGCKSASTPTQAPMPAQPQSQASESQSQPQEQKDIDPESASTSSARSDGEIIADFDTELDASIADFDGMILDERAKAEAIEASLGGDDSGANNGELSGDSGGNGPLFEDGDIYEGLPGYGDFPESADQGDNESNGQQTSNEGASDASHGESTAESSTASPGGPQTTQRGEIPEDIKGGSDDDIVARQIREAALKEKDPALREKLWDEYRKYKNQQ